MFHTLTTSACYCFWYTNCELDISDLSCAHSAVKQNHQYLLSAGYEMILLHSAKEESEFRAQYEISREVFFIFWARRVITPPKKAKSLLPVQGKSGILLLPAFQSHWVLLPR